MRTIAVLRDDLLIVTGIRAEMAHEARAQLKAQGLDVHILWFGIDFEFVDLRDAPPEVTEAAKLVSGFLER